MSGDATIRAATPRNWLVALGALRRLLADTDDTVQVFHIMRALNRGSIRANYLRLIAGADGGRIAYARPELAETLSDAACVAGFAPGTVGAAYAAFLGRTGYSARGLADISVVQDAVLDAPHPYAWFGRRLRDSHDIWHVLTGYRADDPLGEACLVAFTFAQTRGPGWGLIAVGAGIKALGMAEGGKRLRAIWEGYRRGLGARWLPGEDMAALLAEPLGTARRRLGIAPAPRYAAAEAALGG